MNLLYKTACLLILLMTMGACAIPGIGSRGVDYTVSFTTTEENGARVLDAHFDDTWGAPVGRVACCPNELHQGVSPLYRPLPRKAYLRWYILDEGTKYEATLSLPRNIRRIANDMPEYELISSGEKRKRTYLVFNIKSNGQIEAWLTNAISDRNKTGRVRHVVAQAQGTVVNESEDKNDK